MPAKVLFLDIETAPSLGWVWGKWQQDVIDFDQHWYLLSFATKWLGENAVTCKALCDYAGYRSDTHDDRKLTAELHKALDDADIVVAHNGDAFDLKKANARFIAHGMPPPSSYQSVDTLKLARKHFAFESNKLADLGKFFEIGTKLPHTGFGLWAGCMKGDPKSWEVMKDYNSKDVELLEAIYYKLRPWASNHPNMNLFEQKAVDKCPVCQSDKVQKRGMSYTKMYVRQRWNCTSCGTWYSGSLVRKDKNEQTGG